MINLIEVPVVMMDAVKYTSTITSPETLQSTIQWILNNRKGRRGSIEIYFQHHPSRHPITVPYSGDTLQGLISQDTLDLPVLDISATHYGRSGDFNYEVIVIDSDE